MAKTLKDLINEKLDEGTSVETISKDVGKLIAEIIKEREDAKKRQKSQSFDEVRAKAADALYEYITAIDLPISPTREEIESALIDFENDKEIWHFLALVSKL